MIHEFLESISIVIYEALCCWIFMRAFLRDRFSFRGVGMLFVASLSAVFLGCALGTYHQGGHIFRSVGVVAGIFLSVLLFFKGKWAKKLFLSGGFYGIVCGVDYLLIIFTDMLLNGRPLSDVIWVMVALLSKTVLFIIVLLMAHLRRRNKELQVKNVEWILMLCFPIISLMIQIIMVLSYEGRGASAGYLAAAFGIVAVNVVMFVWLGRISEQEKKWNQVRLLQENNKVRMQAYHEMDVDYQESKKILHDYNNQLCCIRGLLKKGEFKEAEAFADKLVKSFPGCWEEIDVRNPVINVLLNQKYRLARAKGIAILFYVNNLSDLWLEEQDIVVLLSNLMDNAIEACEKLEGEDRVIQLKLIREESQLILSIQNPVSGVVSIRDNQIYTDKRDRKNHGIGLKNVQMVLDKYQGIGMMRYNEGRFYYTAAIPKLP